MDLIPADNDDMTWLSCRMTLVAVITDAGQDIYVLTFLHSYSIGLLLIVYTVFLSKWNSHHRHSDGDYDEDDYNFDDDYDEDDYRLMMMIMMKMIII